MGTQLPPQKQHNPQFSFHVCCGQMAGWIKMPHGTEVDLSPGDIVLDGDPARPPPKKKGEGHSTHNFGLHCVAKRLHGSRCHLVLRLASTQATLCYMRTQLPLKRGTPAPQFSAHVCCGQTAGRMKMPLGTEVGLGPGHIVLNRDRAPLEKGTAPLPLFGQCLFWRNGWMNQDAT